MLSHPLYKWWKPLNCHPVLSPWPPGQLLPPWPPSSELLPCAWLLPCRPAAPTPASLPPTAPLCCPSSSRPAVQKFSGMKRGLSCIACFMYCMHVEFDHALLGSQVAQLLNLQLPQLLDIHRPALQTALRKQFIEGLQVDYRKFRPARCAHMTSDPSTARAAGNSRSLPFAGGTILPSAAWHSASGASALPQHSGCKSKRSS